MSIDGTSIKKRDLWHYVNHKIKKLIHHYHVFSIINILFDEIENDLKAGKEIKIKNFGTLLMKNTPPKKYYDVRFQKMMQSPGYRIIRFFLAKKISKKLSSFVVLDKK